MNICECPILNPLQRDGTSQLQRFLPMLDPAYVLSDERSLEDILVFAKEYAAFIRYYDINENNTYAEDWINFIESDITTLISIISVTDLIQIRNDYSNRYKALQKVTSKTNFRAFVDYIIEQVVLINKWYSSAIKEHSLKKDLRIIIKSSLISSYNDLIQYIKNAEEVWGVSLGIVYPDLNTLWEIDPSAITANVSSLTGTQKEKILKISSGINSVFESFNNTLIKLVNDSPDYITESLESYPNHQPHMVLFITFILLFKYAQDNLNNITKSHLDFYYKEVLQLKEKDAVPDKVHLIFELAKNIDKYKLKKDTSLKAGKDATKKNLFYAAEKDVVLNSALVSSLRTIFIEKNFDDGKYPVKNIYSAPVANSADGKGKAFDEEGTAWSAMGKSQWDMESKTFLPEESRTMELAKIGFAVSSPQLFLSEGKRIITLTINFEEQDFKLSELKSNVSSKNFKYKLSGEKEWIEIPLSADSVLFENERLVLTITADQELPSITKYSKEKLGYNFNTNDPVLLLLLNEECTPYEYLKNLKITSIEIKVDVTEARKLVLQNDSAVLNPDKPFYPFGTLPVIGSAFYIGSREIFSKKIDLLTLNITWHGLPEEDFQTYYIDYKIIDQAINPEKILFEIKNDSFKVKVYKLIDNLWPDLSLQKVLFQYKTKPKEILNELVKIDNRDPSIDDFIEYSSKINRGFIKLLLSDKDFQHKKYPNLLTSNIANKVSDKDGNIIIPNEPYTPQMKELTLDYVSEQLFESEHDKFFHVLPFGNYETLPVPNDKTDEKVVTDEKIVDTQFLLPQFVVEHKEQEGSLFIEQEGFLFIGLSKFSAGSNISLLFKVAESSGDTSLEYPKDINWCYLSDNEWIKLDQVNILADTTNDLRTTGIIEFEIPKYATDDDTLMPSGYHWLRASVDENSQAVNKLIDLKAQALVAVFADRGNDPNHLAEPLNAKTISKLEFGLSQVKSITQPYASFGGKTKEVSKDFYTRISERLRHKNRSINIFDYERIVLDKFSSIYKVKCINHSNNCSEIAPGNVTIIPISNLRNQNSIDLLKPQTSVNTLYEIQTHLKKLSSQFINIEIANPQYEEIKVKFTVFFIPGYDKGYYTKKLNDDIKKFLSPWAFDEGSDIVFGGKIHASYILNFVEEREYVDYVTGFEMYHIIGGVNLQNSVEVAEATTSRSILVSNNQHDITYV